MLSTYTHKHTHAHSSLKNIEQSRQVAVDTCTILSGKAINIHTHTYTCKHTHKHAHTNMHTQQSRQVPGDAYTNLTGKAINIHTQLYTHKHAHTTVTESARRYVHNLIRQGHQHTGHVIVTKDGDSHQYMHVYKWHRLLHIRAASVGMQSWWLDHHYTWILSLCVCVYVCVLMAWESLSVVYVNFESLWVCVHVLMAWTAKWCNVVIASLRSIWGILWIKLFNYAGQRSPCKGASTGTTSE
jgi:hypothetical protein